MRIGIVASPHIAVPPASYGGSETIVYHLLMGLAAAGHEPILFATADSTAPCEIVPIAPQPLNFPESENELPDYYYQLDKVNQFIEQTVRANLDRLDIIHSHGFDLIHFKEFPNLTTVHGAIDIKDIPYFRKRECLYYVSISKNQQAAYPALRYVGVVYNGESPGDFPIVEKPQEYVCFLGRIDHEKNPHLAIELAIQLGVKIKVAGKVDFQGDEYFKNRIAPNLGHPLVEYVGELDFTHKIDLVANARCNLHPTGFREPFGLSILEAAYCGTPTLAIARGSTPELIEHGKTGMLVEDFVEGYHQMPECFAMDRAYIAKRARRLFSARRMTRQYVAAYQKVIGKFEPRGI